MNSTLAKIIEAAALKITSDNSHGSGIIFRSSENRLYVATAKHVVETGDENTIYRVSNCTNFETKIKKKTFILSQNTDLAIAKLSASKSVQAVNIKDSSALNFNESIWVAGFSGISYQDTLRISPGSIIAMSKYSEKNGYELIYSNPTTRGMSGGAVLDKEGCLVGIHAAGEIDNLSNNNISNIVYTGANIGVPSKYIQDLLELEERESDRTCEKKKNVYDKADFNVFKSRRESPDENKQDDTLLSEIEKLNISGNQRHELGDYVGAINDYTSAIELSTNHAELTVLYFCRGNSWESIGNQNQAFCDLTYCINIDPTNWKALNNRGNLLLYGFNSPEKALIDARQGIQAINKISIPREEHSPLFVLEGNALSELNDIKAVDSYSNAIRLDPINHHALWGRGRIKAIFGYQDFSTALDIQTAANMGNNSAMEYTKLQMGQWIRRYKGQLG